MALFVTVVWGTTFISSKLLLAAFTPLEIMTFRFVIAWAVLFLLSPRPIKPKSLKGELPFVGAGITGLTLYFILENTALEYTLASNVGIIISAAPMFSALLLWAFRRTGGGPGPGPHRQPAHPGRRPVLGPLRGMPGGRRRPGPHPAPGHPEGLFLRSSHHAPPLPCPAPGALTGALF